MPATIRDILMALVQKREKRGAWIYLVWLAGYCTLLFFTIVDCAVAGVEFSSSFKWLFICAFIGYIQFRFPTVLGWFVLFVPTVLAGVVIIPACPFALLDAVGDHDFFRAVAVAFIGMLFFSMLFAFVHYRPFWRQKAL